MRLINTNNGQFEEFIGNDIPPYAILSHTWEDGEVTLADMKSGRYQMYRSKKGYKKIDMTCRMAKKDGYQYAWVDTCCIDKSSSAELTEAINSMYQWYQRSSVCYVFLSDMPPPRIAPLEVALSRCRWFTRGWTLQELIAPENVVFFDKEWKDRGDKETLIEHLVSITGINKGILRHTQSLSSMSVAQKMSWAASRTTTRIEDTAYCMLGLFNVNMTLLYGEGTKAFRRLQEEIIKYTADFSIFAWRVPPETKTKMHPGARVYCGVLADSPLYFAGSKSLIKLPRDGDWRDFSLTNSGVKIQCQVLSDPIPGKRAYSYVLPLNCSDIKRPVGIRLRKCGPDRFVRENPWEFVEYETIFWPNVPRVRYLLPELADVEARVVPEPLTDMRHLIAQCRRHALQIDYPLEMDIYDAWPWSRCDDEDRAFFVTGDGPWDSGSMRFTVKIEVPIGDKKRTVEFEVMFYALGWSSTDINELQCSLLEYQEHSAALNATHTQIGGWDHNRYQLTEVLIHHKVPRISAVVYRVEGTEWVVVVSFALVWIRNPHICRNYFWKAEFSCKAYQEQDAPKGLVRRGQWGQGVLPPCR
ncbi:HET-domain-containing protein [Cercophora samala]|uniref:HET-domain-containing protein n=1 Tax=Cercophora samala TaxID=330535 RepID=A0AA39Z3F2_9PEZI|nr:HET-domain-containing protein [Cercophora samala]